MRVAIGVLIGRSGGAVPTTIEITSVPTWLIVGVPDAIGGTSNAEGESVGVTVDGETWTGDTVSGGAWSGADTPTGAMEGDAVTVEATVGDVSDSTTVDVLPSDQVDPLIVDWSTFGTCDVSGTWLLANSTGYQARQIYDSPAALVDAPFTVYMRGVKSGVIDILLFRVGGGVGDGIYFDASTGTFGSDLNSNVTGQSATSDGSGGWDIEFTFPGYSGGNMNILLADVDAGSATPKCTANDTEQLMQILGITLVQ